MISNNELLKYGEIGKIIKFFQEIDKIPRKSGNEYGMVEYLRHFAQERNGLEFYTDEFNNVIIKKKSTNGCNSFLAFQSHLDMICEKVDDSIHDFSKDSINLKIVGDFIQSDETSIGADNGIGIAYMLTLLDSNTVPHPNLEMIFTSEEETSMNGAKNIDLSLINSNRIISLDAFSDNVINCGCASNLAKFLKLDTQQLHIPNEANLHSYTIQLKGFKGGHSGKNISENRGNPIICLGQIISQINTENKIFLNNIEGGTWVTSIPVSAECTFTSPEFNLQELQETLSSSEKFFRSKFENPDISLSIEEIPFSPLGYDCKTSSKILQFISHFPSGSILEDKKTSNTILSANLGTIWMENNTLFLENSIRSNLDKNLTQKFIDRLTQFENRLGLVELEVFDFPGYTQDKNSEFIKYLTMKYIELYGYKPDIKDEHFLLECAWFSQKKPNLQYVSISPNIENPHSPYEKVSISSMQKMWEYIKIISRDLDRDINIPKQKEDEIDR